MAYYSGNAIHHIYHIILVTPRLVNVRWRTDVYTLALFFRVSVYSSCFDNMLTFIWELNEVAAKLKALAGSWGQNHTTVGKFTDILLRIYIATVYFITDFKQQWLVHVNSCYSYVTIFYDVEFIVTNNVFCLQIVK